MRLLDELEDPAQGDGKPDDETDQDKSRRGGQAEFFHQNHYSGRS